MKKIFAFCVSACLSVGAMAQGALVFDAKTGVKSKMTVYDGTEVSYTAYERLFYVTNVEDSTYQFLNDMCPMEQLGRHPFSFGHTWVATWPRLLPSLKRAMLQAGP